MGLAEGLVLLVISIVYILFLDIIAKADTSDEWNDFNNNFRP